MRIWINAARPRTLPAAVAPVLVGTAAALTATGGLPRWGGFVAALIASILIQIGTNLANDYSDAKRGADSTDRLGPVRITSAGLATPKRVLHATWAAFGLAGLIGLYLAWLAGPVILVVGAVSIAAGALYTGGPRPYGYAGLGEVFVFLFFGLVAVNGAFYVQLETLGWGAFGLSITVGFLSTAILVVNNVRDIDSDRRAGKNTLAVRIGRQKTRAVYWACLNLAAVSLLLTVLLTNGYTGAALGLLAIPFAIRPVRAVQTRTDGPSLNRALADTGLILGIFAVTASLGLVITS
ncbi:MAG: 1,4-dihydroxy-2-naphthoate polyprenyltransferase [Solirubrobacterales bacterium]